MTIHLDPRTKLFCLLLANLLLFLHVSIETEIVIVYLFLFPFLFSQRKQTGLHFFLLYTLLVVVDSFVVPVATGILLNFIGFLSSGIRMIMPCLISGAYAFSTTSPQEFISALRKMHIPEQIIIPIVVVIRYFPTLREDYRQIRYAMALRGIAIGNMSFIRHPVEMLEYILIPLLMSSNTVAQDLSVAALTKGIGTKSKHTCMTTIQMNALDYTYILICMIPIILYLGGIL